MRTRIKGILLMLLTCCLSMTAFATSEAQYKSLSKTWKLNEDGSQEFLYKMELELYTHTAMNKTYGESFIVYDPTFQELEILESYTRQADGKIIQTPSNAFVEVLPAHAADAPAYNHLKEMVIVHTGLELGATIHLEYRLKSKAGYLRALDIFEPLQQSSPVKEYILTAIVPEKMSLTHELYGVKAKPAVKKVGSYQQTSWKLRNLSAKSTSDFVKMTNGDLPYLALTTYPNQKEAFSTLIQQFDPEVTPAVRQLADRLTKGKETELDQLKSIWNYVHYQLSSIPLELEESSYQLRSGDEVIHSVYGTDIEKTNLLLALLKVAGFKAKPLASYPVQSSDAFALKAVEDLYVSVNDQQYIFNAASFSCPESITFGTSPVLDMMTGEKIEITPAQDYQIRYQQEMTVSEKVWTIDYQEKIGKDLLSYSEQENIKDRKSYVNQWKNGYSTITLKESLHGISRMKYGKLNSHRKVNLLLPRLVDEEYTYVIRCKDEIQLCNAPGMDEIHNTAGDLKISIEKEENELIVKRSLKLNKQLYTPKEFDDLRELLISWSDGSSKTLIFKQK